jgi:hypothetical protein
LQDLGFSGDIFTWTNKQEDRDHIKARHDRFLATAEWQNMFPSFTNTHLVRYSSDHCTILLEFSSNPICRFNPNKQKTNKYEQVWTRHEDHYKMVQQNWSKARGSLTSKLSTTLKGLSIWGHKQFGVVPKRIKMIQNELQELNQKSEEVNMMANIQSKE